ncbi:ATP-binding protein [Anoxybacillus ayderensis]|uniref:sensor histidine kinase n=1 Tax=Anoxybacillus sp. ST70 TaxID=2864180 RepID=UPI000310BD0B|nr:sensor histidine kinase [Anoxybacillus sp. ST70]AXM88191.1 ATP-binding protein [Anoxybacillus ayderensis G10]MBW9217348.1 sensor histidine kinase [Anoxybacillus sp. ST70]THD14701.1 ATP-binding protein [Anoxybacillus ayderensis]
MSNEIFLPIDLNENTAIEFSQKLRKFNLTSNKSVMIDITNFSKNNGRIEPFASLLVINSLRHFFAHCLKNDINYSIRYIKEHRIVNTYAKTLRFYSSLGLGIGETPDTDYVGSSMKNFIPIMRYPVKTIKQSLDEYNEIKKIAERIAIVASRGKEKLFKYIKFCLIELLRNIVEHSESKYFWYCAQYWSSINCVEIAIMDEGIGIHESLKKELDEDDINNALRFSLIPGCSSKPTTHYIDDAENSGFGLYMISEIGKENGDFIIASNKDLIKKCKTNEVENFTFLRGTIIRLRLNIEDLREYELELEELRKKGLQLTENYKIYREKKKYAPGTELPKLF